MSLPPSTRLYHSRLSPFLSCCLLASLLLSLVPSPIACQVQPNYNTGPEIWYTFDVPPTNLNSVNYTWVPGTPDHAGVAVLDGTPNRYIDLRLTADDNGHYLPLALPLTFSLEYWVYYPSGPIGTWMRLFECSDGRTSNSLNVANYQNKRNLVVTIDKGPNVFAQTITDNEVLVPGWLHIAVSLEQTTRTNRNTGTMKMYVNGALVKANNASFLMNDQVYRRNCWIGKSEYNRPIGDDDWLNAQLDDFFYYTYPLSAEAVLAHQKLPRPPVYELTFSNDPRMASPTPLDDWTYTWSDRAEGDSDNVTANHEGHLLLLGDSYIDLAAVNGPSSIYALPLPRIGNFITTGARGTLPAGYSIEVMFKALTVEQFAKIYDIGNGPTNPESVMGVDNIILGYVGESESLRFEWFNGEQSPADSQSFIVVPTLQMRQWYHVVVTMTPDPSNTAMGNITAYVNGQRARESMVNVLLPRNVGRNEAYVGRSHWVNDQYFDMYLDAFRLFDYALSPREIRDLYGSTQAELPSDADPTTTPVYHTAPVAQFTFRETPPSPAPFNYSNTTYPLAGHYGVAQFNFNQSMHQYVDLATFRQPSGTTGSTMNLRFGGGMSFEVWVRYRALRHSSRIFDFGYEYDSVPNSLYLFNAENTPDLVFETYAGEHKSQARINGAVRVGEWQHVVCTVQQNTVNDTTSDLSATFRIYIDGVLVTSSIGSLPYTFNHPSSFLGRSNHPNDEYFEGDIDAFYVYDYAMQYEQVAAHYIVPRPPVFELAFTRDPRLWLNAGEQYTYTWQEFDTNDGQSTDDTGGYHNGFLVLTGDEWINLTSTTGPQSVGTVLPDVLFWPWSNGQGNNGREVFPANNANYGWTIELLVKLMSVEPDVTIFDFGNGELNYVRLGYTGTERTLRFTIDGANPTNLPVLTNVVLGRWYHIVIVMTATGQNGNAISTTAFVDGKWIERTENGRSVPANMRRRDSFMGRSNRPGVGHFDMKLDTFRIYDYALREVVTNQQLRYISKLYNLTSAVLPQLIEPVYYSQPLAQYTFDTPRDETSENGLSYFQWLAYDTADSRHSGVARFNGVDQWVDLMTFLDDTGVPFPSLIGNSSMSFEAWVKYERLHEWSRVFDFGTGNGDDKDNILLASYKQEARVSTGYFPADATSFTELYSADTVNNTWAPGKWQHVVVTIQDRTKLDARNVMYGPLGIDAALWTVYLQGNIVIQSTGYMPRAVGRPAAFLAKSQHTRDQLFEGMIDSFYYYNYALSQEQINAHILLPRPPVFDLSFSSDPRLLLPQPAAYYNYSWQDFDPADTFANSSRFHSGHLVLSAARGNYVNLSTPTGPNTLGVVLPRIGGRQQAISGTSVGWSIEGVVKMDTTARSAKLLDWGNGPDADNIVIGYQSESSRLLLQVYNALVEGRVSSVPVIERVVLGEWYHFVVVIVPLSSTGWEALATVYVDGVQTQSVSDMLLPQYVDRHSALLGRSNWHEQGDALFSAKVDAIRVYDYSLSAAQAEQLYRLAHDSTFVPTPPPSNPTAAPSTSSSTAGRSSTGVAPTGSPGNGTTGSSSSSSIRRPIGPTSSSSGVCAYGIWPNCECRCDWPGYKYPNCRPCPGEEEQTVSGSSVSAGLVIAIVVCVLLGLALAIFLYVYWRNKRGRVTYSLDGGFSDSNDTDGSEWLPGNKRRGAGGGGLLGDSRDDSSTYDWQANRNAQSSGRTDMHSWSHQ